MNYTYTQPNLTSFSKQIQINIPQEVLESKIYHTYAIYSYSAESEARNTHTHILFSLRVIKLYSLILVLWKRVEVGGP